MDAEPLHPWPETSALLDEPGAYARSLIARAAAVAAACPSVGRLYGGDAETHAWRAPASCSWAAVGERLGRVRPVPGVAAVVVVPTRYTFFRLDEVCRQVAALLATRPGAWEPFPLRPLDTVWERFQVELARLDLLVRSSSLALVLEDPDLRPFLEAVQDAARHGRSEVELLHALGAVVGRDFIGVPRDLLADALHRFTPRVMDTLRSTALLDRLVPQDRAEGEPAVGPGRWAHRVARHAAAPSSDGPGAPPLPLDGAGADPGPRGAADVLSVSPGDYHRLEERVLERLEQSGRPVDPPPGEAWSPLPLAGMTRRYNDRVGAWNQVLAPHGLSIDAVSGGVLEMLSAFERGLSGFDPPRERLLLRLLGIASERAFIGPQTVHADVIASCQHRCTFCYTYSPLIGRGSLKEMDRGNGDRLDWDTYLRLLDDLQAMDSVDDLLFNGPGEPLLHPRIMDMLREAKRRGFTTTLFTNGLLLDAGRVDTLIGLEVDRIYWSMHACTPESYDAVHPGRPRGEFDLQVAQGTELMRRRRASSGPHPQVYLVNVLGAETWREAVVTAELAARMGVDHVRLQLTLFHDEQTRQMSASDEQVARIRADLPRARSVCDANGISLLHNIDLQLEGRPESGRSGDFDDCDWSYRRYVRTGCHVGWMFTRIWVDGTLSLCCHPKIVGAIEPAGGFRDAWSSPHYDRVRNTAARWDETRNLDLRRVNRNGVLKGSFLFDKMCDRCGNYEHMDIVRNEMEGLDALRWLPQVLERRAPATQRRLPVLGPPGA